MTPAQPASSDNASSLRASASGSLMVWMPTSAWRLRSAAASLPAMSAFFASSHATCLFRKSRCAGVSAFQVLALKITPSSML